MNPEDYIQFEESYELSGNVFETGSSRQISIYVSFADTGVSILVQSTFRILWRFNDRVCLHGRRFHHVFVCIYQILSGVYIKTSLTVHYGSEDVYISALQVIRFVPGDFNSPVDLLDQDQAYHLMGQGNAAKGDALSAFLRTMSLSRRSANDEGDFTAAVEGKVRKGRRQFFRRDEFSPTSRAMRCDPSWTWRSIFSPCRGPGPFGPAMGCRASFLRDGLP